MVSSKSSSNSPNGFLEFSPAQPTSSVRVENIPDHVDRRGLVALFRSLIGDVQCFRDVKERDQEQLEITFQNRALAAKALCMNGYSIRGATPLVVTAVAAPVVRPRNHTDERRNLYVLGLPFALTKNEFTAIFSRYGAVTHSVILATVDNSSRRRGFVVMASHEEAKRALTALTRTQIKGHTIDVSWAVVQRSQGFLDGGDRSLLLDSRSGLPGSGNLDIGGFSSSGSDSEYSPAMTDSAPQSGMNTPLPTTALLITNLPAMLFSQVQDLHPLLCPFGRIERIQTVQIPNAETISAVVQYGSPEAALEAKIALHGQRYDNTLLETHFVHPSFGESGSNDLRFPTILPGELDNSFSPRASRVPTPMVAFGGQRQGSTLQLTGHRSFSCDMSYPPADAGHSRRDAFSEYTDDHAPSSAYARAGPSRAQQGFNQMASYQNHLNGDSRYQNFAT